MTARTYAFCVGDAPLPWELSTIKAIEVFGVKAVTGKDVLTHSEIVGMKTAALISRLYRQRESSESWQKWSESHPKESEVLEAAHRTWQT